MLLKDQDKQVILNIAHKNFSQSFDILAFGSRVDGSAHEASDLDIVVRGDIDLEEFIAFKENLNNSNIPFLIDVLNWNLIPDYFKDNINKQYEILR